MRNNCLNKSEVVRNISALYENLKDAVDEINAIFSLKLTNKKITKM